MKNLRLIFAMMVITEVIIALMHLVFILTDVKFSLAFYWIGVTYILVMTIFVLIMTPVFNWIIGAQSE